MFVLDTPDPDWTTGIPCMGMGAASAAVRPTVSILDDPEGFLLRCYNLHVGYACALQSPSVAARLDAPYDR